MITVNGIEIKPTIFPDKTSQVWKIDESIIKADRVQTVWDFEQEAEFIHLAQLCDLLSYYHEKEKVYLLHMPYLPYARQDKRVSNDSTFAKHTFTMLLCKLPIRFDEITCFDAHSTAYLSGALIKSISPKREVIQAAIQLGIEKLVYPDKGASDKYTSIFGELIDSVHAEKTRDQITGEITGMILHSDVKEKKVLIVDDICDGGMTFIKLSELLYQNGVSEVNLYISHGLFTKGIQVLKDAGIKRIFTRKGEVL